MPCAHQAAVAALIAVVAVSLQGCGGGGSCPAIEFENGKVAAGSRDGAGVVTCNNGGKYTGPELTCNWVGVKCLAPGDDNRRECGIDYQFGVKGATFDEWPQSKEAVTVKSKDDLPKKQFTTSGVKAEFAGKATEAAGLSMSKRLTKAYEAAKKKADEAAAAAKKKAGEAAAAAKKHGADAVAKAKKAVKGDEAKEEGDKKDDAKAEEKRRLKDDAKKKAKADAKDDAKAAAPKVPPAAIAKSKLVCSAPAAKKDDGKDDAKAKKGDAKAKKDDGKDDAKKAEKLFSVNGQPATVADTGSGWVMPLAGCLAVAGIAFAVLKIVRAPSARSRALDARERDEEMSEEAIE
jgi:hypothetical protein